MIRTEAPKKDNPYYDWSMSTAKQCTWYCYFRAFEEYQKYPTWWSREEKTGKYPNAKNWSDNYRDPWVFKDTSWTPVHGDIAVFDGKYGHVIFIERNNGNGTCLISQYNMDGVEQFSIADWNIGGILVGKIARTGKLKGYLHYPFNDPEEDYEAKYKAILEDMKKIKEVANKYE